QVCDFQVWGWENFISSHVGILSSRLLPLGDCKVRGSGSDLSQQNRAPKRAAISASNHGPKTIAVRWRPWLAIRAIAGDSVQNFNHGALPVPLLCVGTGRRSHSRLWHANSDWFGGATEPFHRLG